MPRRTFRTEASMASLACRSGPSLKTFVTPQQYIASRMTYGTGVGMASPHFTPDWRTGF
jgi:hypothetical protein